MSVVRRAVRSVKAQPRGRKIRWGLGILALVLVAIGVFVIRPFWHLSSQFDDLTYRQPSRLYGRPTVLAAGRSLPAERLVEDLRNEGYREHEGDSPLPTGRYRRTRSTLAVHQRSFWLPDGKRSSRIVEVTWRGSRISSLEVDGRPAKSVALEPALLGAYYSDSLQERRPVTVDEVSQDLVNAVIAAEDDSFFKHTGFSPSGIARALWANFRGGEIRQGGSTLTQQLVKNLYLTHRKTWGRKAQELVLALLLEARYSKRDILEAYLNEIYLGSSGGVSLLGMGSASRAYFGKDPGQLSLAEAATLAGIIQSPGAWSPLAHPERAKERRDWVLGRMRKLRLAEPERIEQALAEPLSVAPEPVVRRRAPYFADAMAVEAQRRFGLEELADAGYVLFSTLDWRSQREAEKAVAEGLERAEKGYEKGRKSPSKGPLQAALVSVDPRTGGILAYVGGRDYAASQFDRAGQALRQAGSAFKPIVYATAFEAGKASPASFLEDTPLTVRLAHLQWSPKNDDGSFHGWVTVRTAIEKSYNPATARLALQTGMPEIVELAHDMGISAKMDPFPSVALGAVEVTPVELAGVYATLANEGVRPPVHGLTAVLDRYGKAVQGAALAKPERALSSQTVYMVTSLLQGVFVRGTARGAAAGIPGDVAGKTGTTNKRRDSWFGGYAPERATVVWVGYDDNATTRLSGARAALPIWIRFMARVAPKTGYSSFKQPPGITTAVIDPTTGLLATEYCPYILTEVFRRGSVPAETCNHHESWYDVQIADLDGDGEAEVVAEGAGGEEGPAESETAAAAEAPRDRKPRTFRTWIKKVFGKDKEDGKRGGEDRKPPG